MKFVHFDKIYGIEICFILNIVLVLQLDDEF